MVTVLQSAHTDEKHFKDPLTFRPERFLSMNGKLNLKLDRTVPFGAGNLIFVFKIQYSIKLSSLLTVNYIGKRLCAGETFARNIMFLFTCTVLQNFNVSVPKGHVLVNPSLEPEKTGIIKSPPSSYLKFTSR